MFKNKYKANYKSPLALLIIFTMVVCISLSFSACKSEKDVDATGKISYITIECKTALEKKNKGELKDSVASVIPDDGYILPKTEVILEKGDTVLSALLRTTREKKIHTSYQGQTSYGTAYVEALGNLFEKDCGKKSGWMYYVNSKYPNYGCSAYKLKGGEDIVWIYTCNNGKDIGAKLEE